MKFRVTAMACLFLLGLEACRSTLPGRQELEDEAGPAFQQSLPLRDAPFDLLADDVDADGRLDIVAISHGESYAQVFFQKALRAFSPGPKVWEVGFHPGDIIRLPFPSPRYLVSSEGSNQLVVLEPHVEGGFKEVGHVGESVPRHASVFQWPRWGVGLAVSPYQDDELVLYKDFDLKQVKVGTRFSLSLSSRQKRTLRTAGRVLPADVDGDGVPELLFASERTNELWMIKHARADGDVNPFVVRKFGRGAQNQVVAMDVNEDASLDLIVPDQSEPFQLHMLLNNGRGEFSEASPLPFPTATGVRQVGASLDKDGSRYILGAGYGALALYKLPKMWDGKAPVPMQSIRVQGTEGSQKLLLQDIDGDGWLDGVIGRGKGGMAIWIVYGPLWDHFQELKTIGFVLK